MSVLDTPSGWGAGSSPRNKRQHDSASAATPRPFSTSFDNSPAPAAPPVSQNSIAQYEIIRQLGKGGMGVVYLAYEPLMHRTIALKVLQREADLHEVYAKSARFLAEAMLTGRLTHAGIIPIYQIGFDPANGYFYSMRYLRGKTLHQIMRDKLKQEREQTEEYPLSRLLDIMVRVCDAVAFAHRNGVLHRDLKPANVMVTDSNEVLVVDWGLAKDLRTHDPIDTLATSLPSADRVEQLRQIHYQSTGAFLSQARPSGTAPGKTALYQTVMDGSGEEGQELFNLTQAGLLVGTPWYMSPEQISGDPDIGPPSDVYALGVILYRILTGAMPVDSKDLTELIARVSAGDIKRIEQRPEAFRLPRALCSIVNKALAFNATERYAHAGELADDLRLYLEGRTPLAPLLSVNFKNKESRAGHLETQWQTAGTVRETEDGVELSENASLCSTQRSLGDLRCIIGFRARSAPWCLSIKIGQKAGSDFSVHHELRLGVEGRSFVELIWRNRRVQRRFDVRIQSSQYYQIGVELDEGQLRLRLDGAVVLSYRDLFPITGGAITLSAARGAIVLEDINWFSRGAPLNLSYQYLPDSLFLAGKYDEAQQLYQQMADSHPDREEGLMGLYKAGLCCAERKDTQKAFEFFSRLENTMLDHCCTLGLARIGMLDGNLEWAWEALKSGYLRHKHPQVRTEIWFALLDVLEQLGVEDSGGKLPRYLEMLKDLDPAPLEMSQITFEYLDLVARQGGVEALRREAIQLIQRHGADASVAGEALQALWRTGLDETTGTIALGALNRLFSGREDDPGMVRLKIMYAELLLAQMRLDEAITTLAQAVELSEHSRADRLWAKNWLLLAKYLKGDFENALSEGRGTLQYMDQYSSDQLAYLLFLVTLILIRMGKPDLAKEAITRARRSAGWWGKVADAILEKKQPETLIKFQSNPNLITESLLLGGEMHLRMGNGELAALYFKACDEHPSRRVMTRQLARARLREMIALSSAQGGGA